MNWGIFYFTNKKLLFKVLTPSLNSSFRNSDHFQFYLLREIKQTKQATHYLFTPDPKDEVNSNDNEPVFNPPTDQIKFIIFYFLVVIDA